MIEWLITDYHFIPTFFFMFLMLFAVMSAVIMSKSAYANSFKLSDFALIAFLNLVISIMATFFISVLILTLTSTKPVGSSEWKTIYDSTGSAAKLKFQDLCQKIKRALNLLQYPLLQILAILSLAKSRLRSVTECLL